MKKEKRLIDADVLIECLSVLEATGGHWLYRKACNEMIQGMFPKLIEEQPTVDAVEVVRCKDCKKSQKWKNAFGAEGLKCYLLCVDIDLDGFCSYGERKDNGC